MPTCYKLYYIVLHYSTTGPWELQNIESIVAFFPSDVLYTGLFKSFKQ